MELDRRMYRRDAGLRRVKQVTAYVAAASVVVSVTVAAGTSGALAGVLARAGSAANTFVREHDHSSDRFGSPSAPAAGGGSSPVVVSGGS